MKIPSRVDPWVFTNVAYSIYTRVRYYLLVTSTLWILHTAALSHTHVIDCHTVSDQSHLQEFRSVLSGAIISVAEGEHGSDIVPGILGRRVRPGSLFLWPLMAMLWAFDVQCVAKRSLTVQWIEGQPHNQLEHLVAVERSKLRSVGRQAICGWKVCVLLCC